MTIRFGSLFSGVEAASLAWEPLGWQPVFFAEVDPFCCAVLKYRWPGVLNLGDVTAADFVERARALGPVDVVIGGSPCQSFSQAGKRGGLSDERGNLTLRFWEVAAQIKPQWVVWENVPGVLSQDGGRAFGTILGKVAEQWPQYAWRVLDARYAGVPQRRRRVFLVAGAGKGSPEEVLALTEGEGRDTAASGEAGTGTTGTVEEGVGAVGPLAFNWQEDHCFCVTETSNPLRRNQTEAVVYPAIINNDSRAAFSPEAPPLRSGQRGPVFPMVCYESGQGWWNQEEYSGTLRAEGENRPSRPSNVVLAFGGGNCSGPIDVTTTTTTKTGLRLDFDTDTFVVGEGPIPVTDTVSALGAAGAGRGYRIGAEEAAGGQLVVGREQTRLITRRLTPRECERLQAMPDDHTLIPYGGTKKNPNKMVSDSARYKAIGNSMAVCVIRQIGERLDAEIKRARASPTD